MNFTYRPRNGTFRGGELVKFTENDKTPENEISTVKPPKNRSLDTKVANFYVITLYDETNSAQRS